MPTCEICQLEPVQRRCEKCGAGLCGQCGGQNEHSGVVCTRCAYAAMGDSLGNQARQGVARIAARDERERSKGRRRKAISLLTCILCIAIFAIFVAPLVAEDFGAKRPFALGDTGEDADGLNECLAGLWQVRQALDLYRMRHQGALPDSVSALAQAPLSCPGCGRAWRAGFGDGDYEIACPTPAAHGRAAIFLDAHKGPPQVRAAGAAGR